MLKVQIPKRYKVIARDSIGLLSADLLYRLSNVVTIWFIAHYLGPVSTGIYSLGSTFRLTLQTATLAGTGYLIIRELSRGQTDAPKYLLNFASMRLGLSLGSWLFLCVMALFLDLPYSGAELVISILGLELVPESIREVTRSGFIAQQRISPYAIIASSTGIMRVIACWGVLATGGSLLKVAASVIFVSWLGNCLGFLKLLSGPPGSRIRALSLMTMKTQFWASVPFLSINVLLVIYAHSNVYLLSLFSTIEELAFYSIADSIVASSSLLTQVYLSLAIPAFSRLYRADDERLKVIHSCSLLVLSGLAFPIATAVSFQAIDVAGLWGEQFRRSALVIGLLIWSLVISWLNAPNSSLIIATGYERISARFLALALGVNLVAGFILIPYIGAVGAAIARLMAELVFGSLHWLFVHKRVSRTPISVITLPVLAVIVMGAARFLLGLVFRTWEALCISLFLYGIVFLLGLFFSRGGRSCLLLEN